MFNVVFSLVKIMLLLLFTSLYLFRRNIINESNIPFSGSLKEIRLLHYQLFLLVFFLGIVVFIYELINNLYTKSSII